MKKVKAKKHLGQHFLTDLEIARKIVEAITIDDDDTVIEVGPGTGVLTQYLKEGNGTLLLSEIDVESIEFLITNLGMQKEQFVGDFFTNEFICYV